MKGLDMENTLLMNPDVLEDLPPLYSQEHNPDPQAMIKYFTPDAGWTWYALEYSPQERLFFGLVVGLDVELGYFSLDELYEIRGKLGLPVERDMWFLPTRLSDLRKMHERQRV